MDCSTPGLPVPHHFPDFAQTHVHWVGDAVQASHPLPSPSPPAVHHSQHQWRALYVSGHFSHTLVSLKLLPLEWRLVNSLTEPQSSAHSFAWNLWCDLSVLLRILHCNSGLRCWSAPSSWKEYFGVWFFFPVSLSQVWCVYTSVKNLILLVSKVIKYCKHYSLSHVSINSWHFIVTLLLCKFSPKIVPYYNIVF